MQTMQRPVVSPEDRVQLDVGGHLFSTSATTLCRPGSMLSVLLSGRYLIDRTEDGVAVFLDRDGSLFPHILEYLRDGVVSVAHEDLARVDLGLLHKLKREFDFFGIDLVEEVREEAYVLGGSPPGHTDCPTITRAMASVERYDAVRDKWTTVAPMPTPKVQFGVSAMNGKLYITGGFTVSHGAIQVAVESYTPATDTWTTLSSMPIAKQSHGTSVVNDVLYVMGGKTAVPDDVQSQASVHKYEDAEWSEALAPMPEARSSFGTCVIGRDVFVFGGLDAEWEESATVFKYNTVLDEWTTLPPMPTKRHKFEVFMLNGMAFLMPGAGAAGDECISMDQFDPGTSTWSQVTPSGRIRTSGFGAFSLGGCIYVVGGSRICGGLWVALEQDATNIVHRFDPCTRTWSIVSSMNARRAFCAAQTISSQVGLFDGLIAAKLTSFPVK